MTIDLQTIESLMILMKKNMIDEISIGDLKILKSHHNYEEVQAVQPKTNISNDDLLFYSAE